VAIIIDGSSDFVTDNRIEQNTFTGGPRGVAVNGFGAIRTRITRNSFLPGGNNDSPGGELGIDLKLDGVTQNDAGDGDAGPNDLLNFPALTSASVTGGHTVVMGTLDSVASSTFTIEVFSTSTCATSGYGRGTHFLGQVDVTTDEGGHAAFSANLAPAPAGDVFVVATSTDAFGNTSEFSACREATTPDISGTDTAGVYQAALGQWSLRNSNSEGPPDIQFYYGAIDSPFLKLKGDWDGDGDDTPALYDPGTGAFFVTHSTTGGPADFIFYFGAGGDPNELKPISGDWNGDGVDTVSLYVVDTGVFFLTNTLQNGPADVVLYFGVGGDNITPVAGDWNGDGVDTIGLYNPATGVYFLRNSNTSGSADFSFQFGGGVGQQSVVGDWNGDGVDTVGLYVPGTRAWFLRNSNSNGAADVAFIYGPDNGLPAIPLAGDWDGH
jgi:hypothetical protein